MARKIHEKRQTVLVGLGGTGSRVVNNVARMLQERNHSINDGKITCVVFDTNKSDNDLIKASGTNIPVVSTCDDKKIREYLARYANMRVDEWCPTSPTFVDSHMKNGASEVRVKSRLAFMDTLENGGIQQFITAIEKVFHSRTDTKDQLRVLVVSSLAGGTGSGMFIQISLWLRQFFESRNCDATIRGILLLPDIFVSTVEDAKKNPLKKLYYYANAYAAIREVNAINKVVKEQEKAKKSGKPTLERPMIIDGVFDSRKPPSRPVFDNAFFVDDQDVYGASFSKTSDYEEVAAQMVYMQLYAPMYTEMISVEDNLYRSFEMNDEPVYGSCGTAKLEYPTMDVVRYCALHAAVDAVAQGWHCLDREIAVEQKKLADQQKDGYNLDRKISVRDKYIELFNEKSAKVGKEITKGDRLFVAIKDDVNLLVRTTGDNGETMVDRRSKIGPFMNKIVTAIRSGVESSCDFESILEVGKGLPDPDKINKVTKTAIEKCKKARSLELPAVMSCIDEFDGTANKAGKKDGIVEKILRQLVPMDMAGVSMNNDMSVYGLFLNRDLDGNETVVHPVAARYLLYKLLQAIEQEQSKLVDPDVLREAAIEGDTEEVSFDIVGTKNKKETREKFFEQVGLIVDKKELAHFIRQYKKYNEKNKVLCENYCTGAVKREVLRELAQYVQSLITEMENVFSEFDAIEKDLQDALEKNVRKNAADKASKVIYVYAQEEHKEEMYQSLNIDPFTGNEALNKSVVNAVYGKFCAANMPNSEENEVYENWSAKTLVYNALVSAYEDEVKKARDKINLSVMGAIRKETEFDAARPEDQSDDSFIDSAVKKDEDDAAAAREYRFREAVINYREQLKIRSVPFLKTRSDVDNGDFAGRSVDDNGKVWMTTADGERIYMPRQTELIFWGFRKELLNDMEDLDDILSVNTNTACSDGYRRNELCCYQSIYGVTAAKIDKFNEMAGGEYYKHYSAVINRMIGDDSEILTPHLDKTWHEFLPFIDPKKEEEARTAFGKTFWCALAYERITLNSRGKYQLTKKTKKGYTDETLLDDAGNPIEKTDVARLIKTLRVHPEFTTSFAEEMKEEYQREVNGMANYEGTKIFGNLSKHELFNPITMMAHFQRSRNYDEDVKNELLESLEEIVEELVKNLDIQRTDPDSVNKAKYKLLSRIYDKSTATAKAHVVASRRWLASFKDYGLITKEKFDADTATANAAANADEEAE